MLYVKSDKTFIFIQLKYLFILYKWGINGLQLLHLQVEDICELDGELFTAIPRYEVVYRYIMTVFLSVLDNRNCDEKLLIKEKPSLQ